MRRDTGADHGNIDMVLKRSFDDGKTWGPIQVVWDDGENTCGNPCAVVDRATGDVLLLMTHNLGGDTEREIVGGTSEGTRTVWVARSADEGLTWSAPREITAATKDGSWTWYATTPVWPIAASASTRTSTRWAVAP